MANNSVQGEHAVSFAAMHIRLECQPVTAVPQVATVERRSSDFVGLAVLPYNF